MAKAHTGEYKDSLSRYENYLPSISRLSGNETLWHIPLSMGTCSAFCKEGWLALRLSIDARRET